MSHSYAQICWEKILCELESIHKNIKWTKMHVDYIKNWLHKIMIAVHDDDDEVVFVTLNDILYNGIFSRRQIFAVLSRKHGD